MIPKDPSKTALTFWVDTETALLLAKVAREKNVSQASILRKALREYLVENNENETLLDSLAAAEVAISKAREFATLYCDTDVIASQEKSDSANTCSEFAVSKAGKKKGKKKKKNSRSEG